MTTVLIVAGETSGDIHGANLARALRELDPSVRVVGAGGSHMRAAGVEILEDPTAHASIGFVEALKNIHRYATLYRKLQSAFRRLKPDVAVLIDSPDFNLPLAGRAKDHGIPVVYYIGPQLWAWRSGRVKTIKRVVRKMLVIFPFEEKLYRDAGVDVAYVGNPLLDHEKPVDREATRRSFGSPELLIGLLPGSRRKQFKALFPVFRDTASLLAKELPGAKFVVACAPTIDPKPAIDAGFPTVVDRTPEVMAASDLLLVASGTATLEAGMYGTPMIVSYKLNPLTAYTLGPIVHMHIQDYALVNIVAGRRIVPEYYQAKAKPDRLAKEALSILRDPGRLPAMRGDLAELRRKMGAPGASKRAAEHVLAVARERAVRS
jgi:lipid-A-disaccharide synthase